MTNNLKSVRIKIGVSRYKMANDLDIVYGTLKNWEVSETLSPDKMKICADYLKVDVNEIFKL